MRNIEAAEIFVFQNAFAHRQNPFVSDSVATDVQEGQSLIHLQQVFKALRTFLANEIVVQSQVRIQLEVNNGLIFNQGVCDELRTFMADLIWRNVQFHENGRLSDQFREDFDAFVT